MQGNIGTQTKEYNLWTKDSCEGIRLGVSYNMTFYECYTIYMNVKKMQKDKQIACNMFILYII